MQSPNPNPPEPWATESPSITPRAGARLKPVAACRLLVVVTLGVDCSVMTHGFVDYDGGDYVAGNPHVRGGLNWPGAKWAFTTGHASNRHPLTWMSHMLDVSLFGKSAGGHPLTSLLFHSANVALVFLVLQSLTTGRWRTLWVAGLFALHPVHAESVVWVSERKDVLCEFFVRPSRIIARH